MPSLSDIAMAVTGRNRTAQQGGGPSIPFLGQPLLPSGKDLYTGFTTPFDSLSSQRASGVPGLSVAERVAEGFDPGVGPLASLMYAGATIPWEAYKAYAQLDPSILTVTNPIAKMLSPVAGEDLTIDSTTSPASMANITGGLAGVAARLLGMPAPTAPPDPTGHTGVGTISYPGRASDSNAPWVDFTTPQSTGAGVSTGVPASNGQAPPPSDPRYPIATNPTPMPDVPMPMGQNFPDLVPDPGGSASNTGVPNTGAPGSVDFGAGSDVAAPYNPVLPDPRMNASNGGANESLDPALAAIYSNTSGAGTSALNLSEATSHPSYMNYLAYLMSLQGHQA